MGKRDVSRDQDPKCTDQHRRGLLSIRGEQKHYRNTTQAERLRQKILSLSVKGHV